MSLLPAPAIILTRPAACVIATRITSECSSRVIVADSPVMVFLISYFFRLFLCSGVHSVSLIPSIQSDETLNSLHNSIKYLSGNSFIPFSYLEYCCCVIISASAVWVCEDDDKLIVPYSVISGNFTSCNADMKMEANNVSYISESNVVPQSDALVLTMPDSIVPGMYNLNLTFGRTSCGVESVVIPIKVYYSQQLLAQRWNDVLAVKNEKYNHLWNDNDTSGYQFIAFQWYKNGQPIEGATSSILYEPDGLDLDAEYYVLLTRLSDNVTIRSCVADLQDLSAKDDGVVVFESNKTLSVVVSRSAQMRIWTSTGILIKSIDMIKGESIISTLGMSGVYILDFLFEDGEREIKQMVFE